MKKNLDIINFAVSLIIKAALIAAFIISLTTALMISIFLVMASAFGA